MSSMNSYTEKQVSEMLNIPIGTLRNQRYQKRIGIPYVKIGNCVRYMERDIEAYLQANRRTN